jgi:hypothetical protein
LLLFTFDCFCLLLPSFLFALCVVLCAAHL